MSQFYRRTLGALAKQSHYPGTLRVIFATENKCKKKLGRLQLVKVVLLALSQESKWCQWEHSGTGGRDGPGYETLSWDCSRYCTH